MRIDANTVTHSSTLETATASALEKFFLIKVYS